MFNSLTESQVLFNENENAALNKSRNSSDISDDDCGDVDEMIVISAQSQQRANMNEKAFQERTNITNNEKQPTQTHQSFIETHQKPTSYVVGVNENNQIQNKRQSNTLKLAVNDSENQVNFQVAYKKLVKQLGQTDGGNLLVPKNDLIKLKNQTKTDVKAFSNKIAQFQDKKRQKTQFLKECLDQKEVQECLFAPKIVTRKRGETAERRNIDQFLDDQNRYEEMKKQKQNERQEEHSKSQISQTLRGPYVNQKSRKILDQRSSRLNSIQRNESLCQTDNKKHTQSIMGIHQSSEKSKDRRLSSVSSLKHNQSQTLSSFQPSIQKKSRDLVRDKPVQDILYQEAFNRKVKLAQKEKELRKQPEKQINQNSLKLVKQKFNREFCLCLHELFASRNENNEVPVQLPKKYQLFAINENAANSDSNERILLYDMWKVLEGDLREEASLDDVRLIIMAILKINDHKRIGVQPDDSEIRENNQQQKIKIGFFNKKGQFCLTKDDIPLLYKQFDLLSFNRIQHLAKVQETKKDKNAHQIEFKPQLNKQSAVLAQSYRQKMANSINEEKIQTFEWLAASSNKEEWRENAKQILQQEEMKECTFQPQLRSRQESSTRGNRQNTSTNTSKTRSKDIISHAGDKFNDLYQLGKKLNRQPKEDKTSEEIEYEKNKEECTFIPNCKRQQRTLEAEQCNDIKILDNRFVQKEVERMRKAREERERVKKFTERGIILNNNNKSSSTIQNYTRPSTINSERTSDIMNSERSSVQPHENESKSYQNTDLQNINNNQQQNLIKGQNKETISQMEMKRKEAETPLLYIDINLGEERQERIVVYDGDSARDLAYKFCEDNDLDEETQQKLEEQLASQIRNVLTKIEEEQEHSRLTY